MRQKKHFDLQSALLVEHPEKKSNSITDSLAQFSKLFSN